MKKILCYGDSNTFGFNPTDLTRYNEDQRWSGILKNKLADKRYEEERPTDLFSKKILTLNNAKAGVKVYHLKTGAYCEIVSAPNKKGEVAISIGSMKTMAKINELYYVGEPETENQAPVIKVSKQVSSSVGAEINVVGKRREEALEEVDKFIDNAVLNNVAKIRIIHGVGMKILSSSIHGALKKDLRVKSFKFADYGDGDMGVTIVELK